jgi:hypothetical protein
MGLFGKATLFTAFFPTYEKKFTNTIAEHCVPVYNEYLRDGRGLGNAYTYPVFNCIMENTTEGTKAAMGATTVLLGLTPVVLSSLGNSTAEMSVLSHCVWQSVHPCYSRPDPSSTPTLSKLSESVV